MPSKTSPVYQLKISLNHIRPQIWRRILVPGIMPLGQLHDVIQVVMGWQNYHLHQFVIDGQLYGDASLNEEHEQSFLEEWNVRLKQVADKAGCRFKYGYDFGDNWEHTVLVEKILPPDPKMRHPVCLEGERACPPEDVGGPPGYARFLQAIRHPRDEEHESYLEWVGGEFRSEAFDVQAVNRLLRNLKKNNSLDIEDGGYQPYYSQPFEPAPSPEPDYAWLEEFCSQYSTTAESLALRKDMGIFLKYLQANRVTGTASSGNLPLKAGAAICASLTKPVPFGSIIGEHNFKVQSSSHVWPLFFLHILASSGGLVEGGAGRRWKVTRLGEKFLAVPAGVQVYLLLKIWMTQVNWGIAIDYAPENFPTQQLRPLALQHLLALPLENAVSFELFADQLVAAVGMRWPTGDPVNQRENLQWIIKGTVAKPMAEFGVLELTTRSHPILGENFSQVSTVRLTAFGRAMLAQLNLTNELGR